jgi:SAM-dependent methyltransferase
VARRGWDAIADWRDRRMGEEGDLWHRAIIDPAFLRLVGPVRGLRVLDLGCGNGYLTRRWARAGALVAMGVDRSAPTLRLATRRERSMRTGARFLRRDAGRLTGLAAESFDLVASNMALMDIRDAAGAVREVRRVLRPGGRFVFSICHPCFDRNDRSMWVVERQPYRETVWRKLRAYQEDRAVDAPWQVSETETATTRTYDRTLSSYVGYLHAAGLAVTRMEEPKPLPEAVDQSPQGRFMLEVPLHLVIEAVRLPAALAPTEARAPESRTSARTPRATVRRSGSGARRRGTGSRHPGSRPGS